MGTMKMARPIALSSPLMLQIRRSYVLCEEEQLVVQACASHSIDSATDLTALLAHAAFTLAAEQLESARGARAWAQATIRLRTILAGADDDLVRVCAEYMARTPARPSAIKKLPALPRTRAKLLTIVD